MNPPTPVLHLRPAPNLEIFMASYDPADWWKNEVARAEAEGIIPAEIHHINRRIEWVVLRHLLDLGGVKEVVYLPNGKPEVIGSDHISISHGKSLAGIALASTPVGLDIQHPEEKLLRIRHKFCSAREWEICQAGNPLPLLTMIWSAKEAVFKYFGQEVHFARDIQVQPFSEDDRYMTALYKGAHGEKEFILVHENHAGHHCVCTLE